MNCGLSLVGRKQKLVLSYNSTFILLRGIEPTYDIQSKHLLIMENCSGTILYSKLANENSDAGHIKCSRGPQVPHSCFTQTRLIGIRCAGCVAGGRRKISRSLAHEGLNQGFRTRQEALAENRWGCVHVIMLKNIWTSCTQTGWRPSHNKLRGRGLTWLCSMFSDTSAVNWEGPPTG